VFRFEAEIEGRRVVGKVKEKEEAKQEYDDAIRHGQTAALLEKKKPDIFKVRIQ
jgi:poly [ADP-ribose] polymerase